MLMRKALLLALLATGLLVGCASRYKVTLTNGTVVTTNGKPRYDKATDAYTYKDGSGRTIAIPSMRVRQIEPISRSSKADKFQYN